MSSTALKYANALSGVTLLAAMVVAVVAGEARARLQPSLMNGEITKPRESILLIGSDEELYSARTLEAVMQILRDAPAKVTIEFPGD